MKKRILGIILAAVMALQAVPAGAAAYGASEPGTAVSEETDVESGITVSEETDAGSGTKSSEAEAARDGGTEAPEAAGSDTDAMDNQGSEVFLPDNTGTVKADETDFSSCRLLVTGGSEAVRDGDAVLADYDGVTLLAFESAEETGKAYKYYSRKADSAEPDIAFLAQGQGADAGTDDTVPDAYANPVSGYSENENPLAALAAGKAADGKNAAETDGEGAIAESGEGSAADDGATAESGDGSPADDGTAADSRDRSSGDDGTAAGSADTTSGGGDSRGLLVALLDTGVPKGDASVTDAVSLVDDTPWDENGHGTSMLDAMKGQNPSVRILSVKVLDKDGRGSVSSVYAGIRYAIDHDAAIINLSLAAVSSDESRVVTDVAKEALDAGITVVAAAGNGGYNAKYFIPANIGGVLTVGACGGDGKRLADSNFGNAVDYLVPAASTSEAAAMASGWLSKSGRGTAVERIEESRSMPFETDENGMAVFREDGNPAINTIWFLQQEEEKTDAGEAPEIDYTDGNPFRMQAQIYYIRCTKGANKGKYLGFQGGSQYTDSRGEKLAKVKWYDSKNGDGDMSHMTFWARAADDPQSGVLISMTGYILFRRQGNDGTKDAYKLIHESDNIKGGKAYSSDDGATYASWYVLRYLEDGDYAVMGVGSDNTLETVPYKVDWNNVQQDDPTNPTVRVEYRSGDTVLGSDRYTAGATEDVLGKTHTFYRKAGGFEGYKAQADSVDVIFRADYNNLGVIEYAPKRLEITYDLNGGTWKDGFEDGNPVTYTVDSGNYPARKGTETCYRQGCTLLGWSEHKTDPAAVALSDVQYAPGSEVTNEYLKKATGADGDLTEKLTLYAVWARKYAIDYVKSGGTSGTPLPEDYAPTDDAFTIPVLTKTGYTFLGWIAGDAATEAATGVSRDVDPAKAQQTITIQKGTEGDLTFRALWKPENPGAFVDEETGDLPELTADGKNRGKYKIVEIHSSPGYINRYQEKEIEIDETTKEKSVEFSNDKNVLVIKKTDADGNPVSGVTFKIWHVDPDAADLGEGTAETRKTGSGGTIKKYGLDPGTWCIVEAALPAGSSLYMDSAPRYVSVDEDGLITDPDTGEKVDTVSYESGKAVENPVTVTVVNGSEPSPVRHVIRKTDPDGQPVEGAEFRVSLKDGAWSAKAVTGADGKITIGNNGDGTGTKYDINRDMRSGDTYIYEETEAPEGYVRDETVHTFEVYTNEDSALAVSDENNGIVTDPKITVKIRKAARETDADGKEVLTPVAGVGFEVTSPEGKTAVLYTVKDGDGAAVTIPDGTQFTALTKGKWTYKEDSVPDTSGLIVDDSEHHFTVAEDGPVTGDDGKTYDAGGTAVVIGTVEDSHTEVSIKKTDAEGKALRGSYVRVWGADVSNRAFDVTQEIAGTDGTAFSLTVKVGEDVWLTPGTYHYAEVFAPQGYVLDSTVRSFTVAEDGNVTFAADGGKNAAPTLDGDGKTVPSGITIRNTPNALTILKQDEAGSPVEGVTFHIGYTAADAVTVPGTQDTCAYTSILNKDGSYTTDKDGKISFTALPAGTYTVKEKSVPEGMILDTSEHTFAVGTDGRITGADGGNVTFAGSGTGSAVMTVTDRRPGLATVRIMKEDAESRERLKGAAFFAYPYKDAVSWDETKGVKAVWFEGTESKAQEKGYAEEYVIENLSSAAAYQGMWHIAETRTPDGYAGIFEADVTIADNGKTETVLIPAENTPNSLTIKKVDGETGEALPGTVFKVWADEESEADGWEVTTGADGTASLGKLAEGTYHYKETGASAGYEITDAAVHDFTVKGGLIFTAGDGSGAGETEAVFTVKDRAKVEKSGEIRLKKTWQYGTLDLDRFEFCVYEWKPSLNGGEGGYDTAAPVCKLVYADGTEDTAGIWKTPGGQRLPITDENGGKYRVVETYAPDGFVADYSEDVAFDPDGEVLQIKDLTAYNQQNRLRVKKVDKDAPEDTTDRLKRLTGAEFTLTRLVGGVPSSERTVGQTGGAGDDGMRYFYNLREGTYALTETNAPDGYERYTGTITVTVDAQGKISASVPAGDAGFVRTEQNGEYRECMVTVADTKPAESCIRILKEDEDGNRIAGVEFTLYKAENGMETQVDRKTTQGGTDPAAADYGAVQFDSLEPSSVYHIVETATSVTDRDGRPLVPDYDRYFLTDADGRIETWSGRFAAGSTPVLDGNGDPVTDAEGNPVTVTSTGDELVMQGDGDPVECFVDTAVNHPASKSGVIRIRKTDSEGKNLEGAGFAVYQWDASMNGGEGGYDMTAPVTNDFSYAYSDDLKDTVYISDTLWYSDTNIGKFKVVEDRTPAGYAYEDESDPAEEKWEAEVVIDPDGAGTGGTQYFDLSAVNTEQTVSTAARRKDADTITDGVTYENLVSGTEYTLTGVLMDREKISEWLKANGKTAPDADDLSFPNGDISRDTDGNPLPTRAPSYYGDAADTALWEYASVKDAAGQPVRVYKNFTPEAEDGAHLADGTVEMDFTFDAAALLGDAQYRDVVVFEQVATADELVLAAAHSDPDDAGQTVRVTKKLPDTPKLYTGGTGRTVFRVLAAALAAALIAVWIGWKRRRDA